MSRLLEAVKDDLLVGDDGYVVFWPAGTGKGAYTSTNLREIADEIDRRNKPWDDQLQKYIKQQELHEEDR